MKKREDIRIRDPFILADKKTQTYYMYGTTDLEKDSYASYPRFSVFVSKDLETFDGPFVVFDGKCEGFWATYDYWAAEVWQYDEKYYLFGSFKAKDRCRATHILESDHPLGPFKTCSQVPQTPERWECLDGTLWIENGIPYMVFCREWLQCEDGEMYAVALSQDLKNTIGEPFLLFKASNNPHVSTFVGGNFQHCRVTDGPFLFREKGKLKMIWSSHSGNKYSVLEATADHLRGPWKHFKPRFDFDGGHAMIFEGFDGKKYFSLHQPNLPPFERAVFVPYNEDEKCK